MACIAPEIIDFAYEGSGFVLVSASGIANGTAVELSTGESGIFTDGKALITLISPLSAGQKIRASIDTEECEVSGCEVTVSKLAKNETCDFVVDDLPPGFLAGKMVCVEKDLYHLVSDGEGGVYPGILIQESCVVCGGINPNCSEEGDLPRYYNVRRCSTGVVYQTSTNLSAYPMGQRVSHPTYGGMKYEGSYVETTSPSNPIDTVTIQTGNGCKAYYNLVSCANGQVFQADPADVDQPLTDTGQRVSTPQGEHYWDGSVTYNPVSLRTNVVVMTGLFYCS